MLVGKVAVKDILLWFFAQSGMKLSLYVLQALRYRACIDVSKYYNKLANRTMYEHNTHYVEVFESKRILRE